MATPAQRAWEWFSGLPEWAAEKIGDVSTGVSGALRTMPVPPRGGYVPPTTQAAWPDMTGPPPSRAGSAPASAQASPQISPQSIYDGLRNRSSGEMGPPSIEQVTAPTAPTSASRAPSGATTNTTPPPDPVQQVEAAQGDPETLQQVLANLSDEELETILGLGANERAQAEAYAQAHQDPLSGQYVSNNRLYVGAPALAHVLRGVSKGMGHRRLRDLRREEKEGLAMIGKMLRGNNSLAEDPNASVLDPVPTPMTGGPLHLMLRGGR